MRTSSDVAIPKPRIIVGDGTEWVKQQCKVGTDFGKRRPPMPTPNDTPNPTPDTAAAWTEYIGQRRIITDHLTARDHSTIHECVKVECLRYIKADSDVSICVKIWVTGYDPSSTMWMSEKRWLSLPFAQEAKS